MSSTGISISLKGRRTLARSPDVPYRHVRTRPGTVRHDAAGRRPLSFVRAPAEPAQTRGTYVSDMAIKIGTSGWSYPSWRPGFYPADLQPAEFLRFYAERFDTVELNSTGYRLPSADQFRRWADAVPGRLRVRRQVLARPARPRDDVPRARARARRPARPGARRLRRAARRRDALVRRGIGPAGRPARLGPPRRVVGRRRRRAARERPRRRAVPLPAPARAAVLRRRPARDRARRSATRRTSTSATRTSRPRPRRPTVCARFL